MTNKSIFLFVALCFSQIFFNLAYAHDSRPVAVTITEQVGFVYHLNVKIPSSVDYRNQPTLVWPTSCEAMPNNRSLMFCPEGLEGQAFSLDFPQYNPSLATFFRFNARDGQSATMMLSPSESSWVLDEALGFFQIAVDYCVLGFEHILGGFDHLLFVLGLLVIAKTPKRILLTVTGFTVAHSITLVLSFMGLISLPILPVEAAIALSILYLAYEISKDDKSSLSYRYPLGIAFGFGLLHGLGFASALNEIGLVSNDVVWSLLFFNVGVEVGQLSFIALVVAGFYLFKSLAALISKQQLTFDGTVLNTKLLIAYVIGVPAAYWVFERSFEIVFLIR